MELQCDDDVIAMPVPARIGQLAAKEANILGVEPAAGHARPDGAAPEGQAWSYLRGEWVPGN